MAIAVEHLIPFLQSTIADHQQIVRVFTTRNGQFNQRGFDRLANAVNQVPPGQALQVDDIRKGRNYNAIRALLATKGERLNRDQGELTPEQMNILRNYIRAERTYQDPAIQPLLKPITNQLSLNNQDLQRIGLNQQHLQQIYAFLGLNPQKARAGMDLNEMTRLHEALMKDDRFIEPFVDINGKINMADLENLLIRDTIYVQDLVTYAGLQNRGKLADLLDSPDDLQKNRQLVQEEMDQLREFWKHHKSIEQLGLDEKTRLNLTHELETRITPVNSLAKNRARTLQQIHTRTNGIAPENIAALIQIVQLHQGIQANNLEQDLQEFENLVADFDTNKDRLSGLGINTKEDAQRYHNLIQQYRLVAQQLPNNEQDTQTMVNQLQDRRVQLAGLTPNQAILLGFSDPQATNHAAEQWQKTAHELKNQEPHKTIIDYARDHQQQQQPHLLGRLQKLVKNLQGQGQQATQQAAQQTQPGKQQLADDVLRQQLADQIENRIGTEITPLLQAQLDNLDPKQLQQELQNYTKQDWDDLAKMNDALQTPSTQRTGPDPIQPPQRNRLVSTFVKAKRMLTPSAKQSIIYAHAQDALGTEFTPKWYDLKAKNAAKRLYESDQRIADKIARTQAVAQQLVQTGQMTKEAVENIVTFLAQQAINNEYDQKEEAMDILESKLRRQNHNHILDVVNGMTTDQKKEFLESIRELDTDDRKGKFTTRLGNLLSRRPYRKGSMTREVAKRLESVPNHELALVAKALNIAREQEPEHV